MEQWQTIFLGSKITADGDCSHEIKRHLAPWKKSYDQPREQIKKQRHLPTKVQLVKTMVFPVVMFRCERWTIKKAQRWGTDAFELWCCRRLLSPLDFKEIQPVHPKGNQSWIFIDWYWSSNTLATWCKELTQWKRLWYWERLKTREGDDRGWDGWMASPTGWTWVWASLRSWWWTGRPGNAMLQSMGSQSRTGLSNWTGRRLRKQMKKQTTNVQTE